jgi:undecaprenyl-diphosphatase
VVSSPARLDRQGAAWTAGVLATGGIVYAYDEEILEALRRSREDDLVEASLEVGDALEPIGNLATNPYYLAGLAVGAATGLEPLQEVSLEILESHLISGGVRNTVKLFVGRPRPFEERGARFFAFNRGTSFPSGHASVAFELATILSHHARSLPVTVACYGLATTIALQRVDARTHWPSDVLFGAVTGTVVARTVLRRHQARRALLPALGARDGVPTLVLEARW